MKEKILSFLKTSQKLSGVQDSYLLGVAEHYAKSITEETQIATTFTDGVLDLLKLNADILQREGDRRATEAGKTALKTFQEKHGLDENGKPLEDPSKKKKKEPASDPNEPEWFKSYREEQEKRINSLNEVIEAQKKEKTTADLATKVKSHDKLKSIPASFLKGRNLIPESEDKIEQLVTELETDWNAFSQDLAEKGVHISIPPSSDGKTKEGEAAGKKIAEKHNQSVTGKGTEGKQV
jgi:hypothetical protein